MVKSLFEKSDIRSLTSIRGIAACFVVLYHFVPNIAGPGLAGNFLKHGYLSVDLFFILSGFVMAMTYGGEFQFKFQLGAYWHFLGKRLGRVYPLYLAMVLICILLDRFVDHMHRSWEFLVSNLLMVQAWGIDGSIIGPGWSISTEAMAYLLFPLLTGWVLFGSWVRASFVALLSIAMLLWIATRADIDVAEVGIRNGMLDVFHGGSIYPLLRCLAGFALGLFAWRMASVRGIHRIFARPWVGDGLALLILALMAIKGTDIGIVLLFVPFIITLATEKSWVARAIGDKIVHWLGLISYSIYLVHRPVSDFLRPVLMPILHVPHAYSVAAALLVPVTFAGAAACYYWIEKPGRRWSRALLDRKTPAMPRSADPITAPTR